MNVFQSLLDNFRSNTGLRGPILKMLSGTGYAAIAGYVGMIILARVYPKEAWAVNDYVISLVGVLAPIVSLRYEDALMLAEDDRDAAHAFLLATLCTILISSLVWVALPVSESLGVLLNAPLITTWLWVVPFILILFRVAKISELWLVRHQDFGRVPIGQIAQTSSMVVSRLGLAAFGAGPAGLILGYIVGWIASIVVFGRRVITTLTDALSEGVSFERLKYIAVRYRRFPAYTAPAAMISAFGVRLPVLVLALYFPLDVIGEYGRAVNLLFVPLSFIGVAVGQVFFVRAVQAHRTSQLFDISSTIHARMVMLTLLPTGLLMAGGPDIFAFMLGEQWRASGEMTRFIAPWIFITAVSSPMTRLYDVLERQRLELILNIAILIVIATALVFGSLSGEIKTTLLILGFAGTVIRAIQLVVLMRLADVEPAEILWPYLQYGLYCIPWLLPVIASNAWYSPFITTLCSIIAAAGYFATIVLRDDFFKRA